jgi:sugar O-acyltransferase (sialic acid O-acetyltransferase NeuD family)
MIRDVEDAQELDLLGFIDDGEVSAELMERCGTRHLGSTETTFKELPAGTRYIVGIGNGTTRREISAQADAAGLRAYTLIHPLTTVGVDVEIGEGTVICAGVQISSNLRIGRHVNLNPNCNVGHDVEIADFVTVYPLSSISGYVKLRERSTIGATSVINPSVEVGEDAFVASGAAVTDDVPARTLVAGVPATVKKQG